MVTDRSCRFSVSGLGVPLVMTVGDPCTVSPEIRPCDKPIGPMAHHTDTIDITTRSHVMSRIPTNRLNQRAWLAALLAAFVVVAGAHAQGGRDINKVNGGIDVAAGDSIGDASTVNGGIKLGARAEAGAVTTVNGGIRLDEGAKARSLESVNGGVRMADNAQISGTLDSVNGSITLLPGARVDGDLGNVNGTITLDAAHVGGLLSTTNGSILIGSGSTVEGGLLVRKPKGWNVDNRPPRIVIGPDTDVRGTLTFEREVRLYVHDRARIGRIEGATPQRYSGSEPPSD